MRINTLESMQNNQIVEMIYMKNNGEINKQKVKVISIPRIFYRLQCFLSGTKRTFKIENVLAFVPIIHKECEVV